MAVIEQELPVRSGRPPVPRSSAAPHPALRSALSGGYAGFTEPQGPHVVLPATASVGLIVKIEDTAHRPPAFVMGGHGAHALLDGACAPAYLRVFLRPPAAYTLVGMPLNELRGQAVDLADIVGRGARTVSGQVRAEPTWTGRFGVLDRVLLGRWHSGPRPAPEVSRAFWLLETTGGGVPVRRVADEVGWSHKHLITRFTQQIGLTPKAVARLLRFDRVLRALDRPTRPGWERIAAESGYADQSHLIRDFRLITGGTPSAFLARTRPADARREQRSPGAPVAGHQPGGSGRFSEHSAGPSL